MYRTLQIHAYDMFESVVWSLEVREYERVGESTTSTVVGHYSGTIPGKGHPLWPHWVQDIIGDIQESS